MTARVCNLGNDSLRRAIDVYLSQIRLKNQHNLFELLKIKSYILSTSPVSSERTEFENWLWQWGGYMRRVDGKFTLEFVDEKSAVWFSLKI